MRESTQGGGNTWRQRGYEKGETKRHMIKGGEKEGRRVAGEEGGRQRDR